MKTHADVILAFGSPRKLAQAVGVPPERAIHWPKRGIPSRYWPLVEKAAAEAGMAITALDLAELNRSPQPQEAA